MDGLGLKFGFGDMCCRARVLLVRVADFHRGHFKLGSMPSASIPGSQKYRLGLSSRHAGCSRSSARNTIPYDSDLVWYRTDTRRPTWSEK